MSTYKLNVFGTNIVGRWILDVVNVGRWRLSVKKILLSLINHAGKKNPPPHCSTGNFFMQEILTLHQVHCFALTNSPHGGFCYHQYLPENLGLTVSPARVVAPTLFYTSNFFGRRRLLPLLNFQSGFYECFTVCKIVFCALYSHS